MLGRQTMWIISNHVLTHYLEVLPPIQQTIMVQRNIVRQHVKHRHTRYPLSSMSLSSRMKQAWPALKRPVYRGLQYYASIRCGLRSSDVDFFDLQPRNLEIIVPLSIARSTQHLQYERPHGNTPAGTKRSFPYLAANSDTTMHGLHHQPRILCVCPPAC